MGKMSIVNLAYVNLPPNQVGDNSVSINYGETKVFSVADFTINTTPPYSDPEGDAALNLKIKTLPASGSLKYNNIDVVIDQIIPFTGIANDLLTYRGDLGNTTEHNRDFDYEIADAGSGQFVA